MRELLIKLHHIIETNEGKRLKLIQQEISQDIDVQCYLPKEVGQVTLETGLVIILPQHQVFFDGEK